MTGLRRTPIQRRMSTTRRKSTDRMAAARPILEERSGGNCEICGQVFPAYEAHHRLSRARGGGDEISNLILICAQDHRAAHSRVSRSEDSGWILPSGSEPGGTSLLYMGLPAFLTDEGEVLYLPDTDEITDPDHAYDVWLDQGNGIA